MATNQNGFDIVDGGDIFVTAIVIALYGDFGVGKTTTALTAKNVMHWDCDGGIQRCDIRSGKSIFRVKNWKFDAAPKLANMAEYMKEYDTLIIDTVDALLKLLKIFVKDRDPKGCRDKRNMYGAMKDEFDDFLNRLISLGKDVILLAHKDTVSENDIDRSVMLITGGSKNIVAQRADFMGYIRKVNNQSVISFNPTDNWDGKTVSNYISEWALPNCFNEPEYFAIEIQKMKDAINSRATKQMEKANEILSYTTKIKAATNADEINSVYQAYIEAKNNMPELMQKQIKAVLQQKIKAINVIFNTESKLFESAVKEPAPETKPEPPAPEPPKTEPKKNGAPKVEPPPTPKQEPTAEPKQPEQATVVDSIPEEPFEF